MNNYLTQINNRIFGIQSTQQIKPHLQNVSMLRDRKGEDFNENLEDFGGQDDGPKSLADNSPAMTLETDSDKRARVIFDSGIKTGELAKSLQPNIIQFNSVVQKKVVKRDRKDIHHSANGESTLPDSNDDNKNVISNTISFDRSGSYNEKESLQDSKRQSIKLHSKDGVFRSAPGLEAESIKPKIIRQTVNNKKHIIEQKEDASREIMPSKSSRPSFPTEATKPESRLVIGKLTVEVVQTPEKKLTREFPKKQYAVPQQSPSRQTQKNSGIKVQFGMGQI